MFVASPTSSFAAFVFMGVLNLERCLEEEVAMFSSYTGVALLQYVMKPE